MKKLSKEKKKALDEFVALMKSYEKETRNRVDLRMNKKNTVFKSTEANTAWTWFLIGWLNKHAQQFKKISPPTKPTKTP